MTASKKQFIPLNIWNNYWFHPAPSFNLAICRIIIIGVQLGYLLVEDYAPNVMSQTAIPGRTYSPLPVFQLLNAPFPWHAPPSAFLIAVLLATFVSGALSVVGFKTNFNLLVFALGNVYIQTYLYSFGSFHHPEAIMLIALFILALSPAGKAISIDDFSDRLKRNLYTQSVQPTHTLQANSLLSRWPLLLIQWLFAITYFSAALNKLSVDGPGLAFSANWMNGYTLQYYLLTDGLLWNSSFGVWLGHQHQLAIVSSWVAILFESTIFLTLIFPKLVWIYVPTGIAFHLGIYFAQRAPFFQYLPLYAVFIPWSAVAKAIAHRLKRSYQHHPKPELIYDSSRAGCIRAATLLRYFDWSDRLAYSPQQSLEPPRQNTPRDESKLSLAQPNGTQIQGNLAFRKAIRYIPPLWPLLPLTYLPTNHQVAL